MLIPRDTFINGLRVCTKCKSPLPAKSFSVDTRNKVTGLQTWCKRCVTENRPVQLVPDFETKMCPKCDKDLPIGCFGPDKKSKYNLMSHCKQCYTNTSIARHNRLKGTAHYESIRRAEKLRRKYGITHADYDRMLLEQNGVCAICSGGCSKQQTILDVDHCQRTGKVRGLLCRQCNQLLGCMHDSVIDLNNAKNYLGRASEKVPVRTVKSVGGPKIYLKGMSWFEKDLRKRHGITEQDYNTLKSAQRGMCAICSSKSNLCVDHSHKTSIIRGLLCKLCNVAIGLANDNTKVLSSAAQYLQKSR